MTDRPGVMARVASWTSHAASTDLWFFRRLTIYLSITGCFALIVHTRLTEANHETARLTITAASWIWALALILHVLGPEAEKLLTAFASRFTGVQSTNSRGRGRTGESK